MIDDDEINNDSVTAAADGKEKEKNVAARRDAQMPPMPPLPPIPPPRPSSSGAGTSPVISGGFMMGLGLGIGGSPSIERNRSGSNAKEREGDAFAAGRKLLMDEIDEHHDEHALFHSLPGSLAPTPLSSGSPALSDGPVTLAHSIDAHAHHTDYNRQVPISAAISIGVKSAAGNTSHASSPPTQSFVPGMLVSANPTPRCRGALFTHNDLLAASPPGSPRPVDVKSGSRKGCLHESPAAISIDGAEDATPEPSPRGGARKQLIDGEDEEAREESDAAAANNPDADEWAEYHMMMARAKEICLREEKQASLEQLGEHLCGVDLRTGEYHQHDEDRLDHPPEGNNIEDDKSASDGSTQPQAQAQALDQQQQPVSVSVSAPVVASVVEMKSVLSNPYKRRLRQLQRSRHPVHVQFAAGTASPSIDSLAVGIVAHQYNSEGGFMEYTLQLWQNGRSWFLTKRYSHFQTLQTELQAEYARLLAEKAATVEANRIAAHSRAHSRDSMSDTQLAQLAKFEEMHRRTSLSLPPDEVRSHSKDKDRERDRDGVSTGSSSGTHGHGLQHMHTQSGFSMLDTTEEDLPLPELPKKRWFETQRWLNRHDHMYAYLRRQGLQDFLKMVIKVPLLVARSKVLQRFLELDKTPLNSSSSNSHGSSVFRTSG